MIKNLTPKKKGESREKLSRLNALRAVKGGLSPDPDEDNVACFNYCFKYCGALGNEATMYVGNKAYR